jgi:hypothetical protein
MLQLLEIVPMLLLVAPANAPHKQQCREKLTWRLAGTLHVRPHSSAICTFHACGSDVPAKRACAVHHSACLIFLCLPTLADPRL